MCDGQKNSSILAIAAMLFFVFALFWSLATASVVRRSPQTITRTSTVFINSTITPTAAPTGACSGCDVYLPSPKIEFVWPRVLWTTQTVATVIVQIDTVNHITQTTTRTATVTEIGGTTVTGDLTSFWESLLKTDNGVAVTDGTPTLTYTANVYTSPGAYTRIITVLPYTNDYYNLMFLAETGQNVPATSGLLDCMHASTSQFGINPASAGLTYNDPVDYSAWRQMLPAFAKTCTPLQAPAPASAINAVSALTATTTEYGNLVAQQSTTARQTTPTVVAPIQTTTPRATPQPEVATTPRAPVSTTPAAPANPVTTSQAAPAPANPVTTSQPAPANPVTTSQPAPANPVTTSQAPPNPGQGTTSQAPVNPVPSQGPTTPANPGPSQGTSANPAPGGTTSPAPANPGQGTSSPISVNPGSSPIGSSANPVGPSNSNNPVPAPVTVSQGSSISGPSSSNNPVPVPISTGSSIPGSPGSSVSVSGSISPANPPVSGTTSPQPAQGSATPAPAPAPAGSTSAPQGVVISGTTITAGASAVTIAGTSVSLGTGGTLVVGSETLVPVITSAPVVAGTTLSVGSSEIVIGSTTISAGSAAIIDGTVVSLAPSGTAIVVGSSTYPATTSGYGSLIWSGLGGSATTIATASASLQPYTGGAEKRELSIWSLIACSFVGVIFL